MDTNPEVEVSSSEETLSPEDQLIAMYAKADEAPADEAEPEVEAEPTEEVEAEVEETDQPAEAFEEVEYGGSKHKLRPVIAELVKKADSLQGDYTRKTQEVAEQRKVVEDRGQYLAARELILQSAFKEAAEVESIQAQLKQFEQLDWNSLVAEDAQKALQLNFARQTLQGKLAEKEGALREAVQRAQAVQEQHKQRQLELGQAELVRRLGGKLTDETRKGIVTKAINLGFTEKEIAEITDPRVMHAIHLAAKLESIERATQSALTKKVPQAKPMQTPAGRTSQITQAEAERQALEQRLRRTGRPEDAAAVFAAMYEKRRKR